MSEPLTIGERYRGFDHVAHGGYVSGLLARSLDADSARVRLRRPPPIGSALEIERDGTDRVVLRDGDAVVAEATGADLRIEPPREVAFEEAEAAARIYPGHAAHLFPACFGCGPGRRPGDGLRLFPGRLERSDVVAAPFVPPATLADENGELGSELAWAAVDCPQLWALILAAPADTPERVVTGELAATVAGPLHADRRYVVIAWPAGRERNRLYAEAAVLSERGEPIALARQTAVVVGSGVPLALDAWR